MVVPLQILANFGKYTRRVAFRRLLDAAILINFCHACRYKGEIGFFDFYVIPLAKKLKECGVFGVSSGECLNYATKNKQEWEAKGAKIVETLVAKAEHTYERLQRNRHMDLKNSVHRRVSNTASTKLLI